MICPYTDRVAIIGSTGSGKSELARHLFEAARCRRVLVDSKRTWTIPGVQPVSALSQIDWTAAVIHVQPPGWRDRGYSDELYGQILRRLRHALVWTDEAYGVSSSGWPGSSVDAFQATGRELELGHLACMQRPVHAAVTLATEAEHVFLFPPLKRNDLETALGGLSFVDTAEVERLCADVPRYGYLWLNARDRDLQIGDPLPDWLRRPRLVFRRSELTGRREPHEEHRVHDDADAGEVDPADGSEVVE